MEKIILFLLISFSIVQSQDSEPQPWEFVWGFSSTPRAFVLDSFKQQKMFTGFQWGSSIANV